MSLEVKIVQNLEQQDNRRNDLIKFAEEVPYVTFVENTIPESERQIIDAQQNFEPESEGQILEKNIVPLRSVDNVGSKNVSQNLPVKTQSEEREKKVHWFELLLIVGGISLTAFFALKIATQEPKTQQT